MLNRVPLSLELREESLLHSSSQWSSQIFPPGIFKLPIDEWASCLSLAEKGVGVVWLTFKMSPRSRPVVRSKGNTYATEAAFLKYIYGFPENYLRFSLGKVFRLESSDIYPLCPAFLLIVLIWVCLCKHFFSVLVTAQLYWTIIAPMT